MAGGLIWFATGTSVQPAYLTEWLPATLLLGAGIGLTFPILSAAAVADLPQHRFAVGGAVNQTCRQVGGALGIAVLVALLGTPHGDQAALTAFHHVWIFGAAVIAATGVVALFQRGRIRVAAAVAEPLAVEPAIPMAATTE
jgi:hypothetical protein